MKDNRMKRWLREHRAKRSARSAAKKLPDRVRLVYRCKSPEESQRRTDRAKALVGTPFLRLAPELLECSYVIDGAPVPVEDIEMVYNDMLLMDAISDQGKDGPLYADTLETELERKILKLAIELYRGAQLPALPA